MAKKRVTIYVEEADWEDIKKTVWDTWTYEKKLSVGEYLIGLHKGNLGGQVAKKKKFNPEKHIILDSSEDIRVKVKIRETELDRVDSWSGGYSKEQQTGKK